MQDYACIVYPPWLNERSQERRSLIKGVLCVLLIFIAVTGYKFIQSFTALINKSVGIVPSCLYIISPFHDTATEGKALNPTFKISSYSSSVGAEVSTNRRSAPGNAAITFFDSSSMYLSSDHVPSNIQYENCNPWGTITGLCSTGI